ncbi:MAG: hypothetical protein IT367_17845 [Candidatus Hydrogenedentes bacterium]|nr:hypothetical protein [Candidatus Hydrogenedentota bacterium]
MDLLVSCKCGHQMTVSEYAAGMTAPCPKCGQPLTVSQENSKPITRESEVPQVTPAAFPTSLGPGIQYTPLQTVSLKNNCARCGREFRGDWDRHQSTSGLVCNICWNLVQQTQNLQSTGYVAPVDSMKLDPVLDPQPQQPVEVEEVEKTWREKYWPDEAMMQRIAIGGAIAFGLYTVYLFISGAWVVGPAPEDLKQTSTIAEGAPLPDLPMWAAAAMTVLSTASSFVSTLAGIYIFLMIGRRLPDTNVLANLIQILPAAAVITLLYFAGSVLPFAGIVVVLIFIPAVIFISFGFEAQDIINFPVAMALAGVLQFMCYLLIHWVIAEIAL